jgi:hypothetical protein
MNTIAGIYVGLGEKGRAREPLERAVAERERGLTF